MRNVRMYVAQMEASHYDGAFVTVTSHSPTHSTQGFSRVLLTSHTAPPSVAFDIGGDLHKGLRSSGTGMAP